MKPYKIQRLFWARGKRLSNCDEHLGLYWFDIKDIHGHVHFSWERNKYISLLSFPLAKTLQKINYMCKKTSLNKVGFLLWNEGNLKILISGEIDKFLKKCKSLKIWNWNTSHLSSYHILMKQLTFGILCHYRNTKWYITWKQFLSIREVF